VSIPSGPQGPPQGQPQQPPPGYGWPGGQYQAPGQQPYQPPPPYQQPYPPPPYAARPQYPGPGQPPPPYGPGPFAPPQQPRQTHTAIPSPAVLLPLQSWLRDRSLRNWITVLFVSLVVLPSFVLVLFPDPTQATESSWVFAVYFACAWLLVLWISVRPPMVRPLMLAEVAAIGLVLEAPVAIWLERTLHAGTDNIFSSIFTVGVPEELAKALPIAVLAYLHRATWASLTPKDYLFLGAVSGLAFGAAEAVEYVTKVIPGEMTAAAQQGASPAAVVLASITQGSWRFVTDPMSHAIWAGITGYFIGLAIRFTRHRVWLAVFGLLMTAVLHGINDTVAGHIWWILEIIVSVLLFVAYSQAGGVIEQDLSAAEQAAGAARPRPPGPGGPGGPWPGAPAYPAGWGPPQPAPAWNPAAGWGATGFTPVAGYRPPPPQAYPPQPYPPQSGRPM
jgi:RsiW-degrading membrane proteinase PrsW (M82 family)